MMVMKGDCQSLFANRRFLIFFIPFIMFFLGCINKENTETHGIKWYEYEEGIKEASERNKPILIYFYSKYCPGCRMMEKKVFTNERVIEKSKEFICVKKEISNKKELEHYNIATLPTIIFMKENREVGKMKGYHVNVNDIIQKMEIVLDIR